MNKKQWNALGFLFMLYMFAFIFIERTYDVAFVSDASAWSISRAIVDGIATILVFVSFMASLTCWRMGMLE